MTDTLPPRALRQKPAEAYLGLGEDYLDDAPIPKCDVRKPGRSRPVWVWMVEDLDAFLYARRLMPGQPSPFGEP